MLVGKAGKRWMVARQPAEADNIYVEGGPGSCGMAGQTLNFTLEDGTIVPLHGPWKTSARRLFEDTGYDARDKYTSFGIIALEREDAPDYKAHIYRQILHKDDEPVIGDFYRLEKLAQQFADDLGTRVFFGMITDGGGYAGFCDP